MIAMVTKPLFKLNRIDQFIE